MSEVKNKIEEEVKQGKAIKNIINDLDNDEMQELVIEDLGINREIFGICPKFLDVLSDALGAIARGDAEQRNVGINFIESMERIKVIKPGATLEIKDIYYNFKESKIRKVINSDSISDEQVTKALDKIVVNVPKGKDLTKEEVTAQILEQMTEQKIDIDDKTLSYLVEYVWETYKEIQESVESESKDNQEENSNV